MNALDAVGPAAASTTGRGRPGSGSGDVSAESVLRQLSRPSRSADRRRFRLIYLAVTGCGMFLLATIAVLSAPDRVHRVWDSRYGQVISDDPAGAGLAPYVGDPALRVGTAIGALLLVVPFVVFGWQALRIGTAARERRLAALSLAGATRRQLRRLAFLEGTRAAVIGGILAGPGYLVLWAVFGVLLPDGGKMLPRPGFWVLSGWPLIVVLVTAAGGAAAVLAADPASVAPLGRTHRRSLPPSVRSSQPSVWLPLLLALGSAVAIGTAWSISVYLGVLVLLVGVLLIAFSSGPWLMVTIGQVAVTRGLVTSIAGRRLLADPRTPGRVAGVLFTVGIAFGAVVALASLILTDPDQSDPGFYLWGYAAAGLGALLAALVATFSLVVGVIEQVLDGRRATAALVALAVSPRFVVQVVERQLLLASVPAASLGSVVGYFALFWAADGGTLMLLPIAVLIAAGAAALGALLAARAIRPVIRESSSPDNLRAP